ncbi:MAG TPA: hypothetical protein PK086_03765 [bacterium]|nr:hypothetical protein [bacterium]
MILYSLQFKKIIAMKKLSKKQFFLAISAGILLLILLAWLKERGWILFPEIEKVRLYKNQTYALGAPEFFKLPRPYSRFWDIFFLPIFIYALAVISKKTEANLWILTGEMLIILALSHYAASTVVAIYAGMLFAAVGGLVFNEFVGIFLALIFGIIVGFAAFGLLFGLLLAGIAYLLYQVIKFFIG